MTLLKGANTMQTLNRTITLTAAGAVALLLAACATTSPESEAAVEQARTEVQTLESNPMASQTAGQQLQDARAALGAAEQAAQQHKPAEQIDQLAYLARRRAETGEAVIAEAQARQQMSQAQSQREQVIAQQRQRQAQAAEAQARQAQMQAAESQQQAAAAQQELAALKAKQTDRGMVLTLGSSVLFDTGSDVLKPGADAELARVSQFMQDQPNEKVQIDGYTDSQGSDSYNDALSQRRAQAVAQALENRGIDPSRIQAVGRGKELPVASNDTAAGRQQNRRVEIVFSDTQGRFASAQ